MPFGTILGHRKLVALLSRSIERGSLPPSLIFSGGAGVGKRLTAVAVAEALNCLNPRPAPSPDSPAIDACGSCAACTRIARGVHPDVIVIGPGDTGSIKIEPVRDLIDRASYRPFEGRRRVVILNEADALVPQAQNALLKTLEEPPSASTFILVTARPDALLATVRSRCPELRFQPLSPADVAKALVAHGRDADNARAIAATADGSIGHALGASGADSVLARRIALSVLTRAASTDDPGRRLDSAKDLLTGTPTKEGAAADRDVVAAHLRAVSALLRDIEAVATGASRDVLANPDIEPELARLSAFQGDRGTQAFAAIDQALVALERNAGVKVVADWVVLNI